jgi:hypothetical protein
MGKMLPLETKKSGGKILPHSDLREGMFLEEASPTRQYNVHKNISFLQLLSALLHHRPAIEQPRAVY